MTAAPSADFQLRFLTGLQRILGEGLTTATYKFALIHALADLSVQRGDAGGGALRLPVRAIGERFVELYWRQVAPWPGSGESGVLAQNTGRQAAIVNLVREARARYGGRVDRLRADPREWEQLAADVDGVVRKMPLLRLQTVGAETVPFLYENRIHGRGREAAIVLEPGIAYCFRALHPLVLDLVRGAWMRFVVVAHEACNGAKADHLAAERHLERWVERNDEHAYKLAQAFDEVGVGHDRHVSVRVTGWAYRQVEERRGLVWVRGRELEMLGEGWAEVLETSESHR